MLTVVIDTNVLLQCLPLGHLDWSTLDPSGVRIIIPVTVMAEIDKAKSSGTSRRANRARTVSSMFNEALSAELEGLPLRPGSLSRWQFGTIARAEHSELDMGIPDHRILAEALAIAQSGQAVVFLTHDAMPRLLANRIGLRTRAVPDEWLLPPETDTKDKRIRELEVRMAELERAAPTLEARFEVSDVEVRDVTATFSYWRLPRPEEMAELMELVRERYPLMEKIDPNTADLKAPLFGVLHRKVPTDRDYEEYRDKKYPRWLKRAKRYLAGVPVLWDTDQRIKQIRVVLRNAGRFPADGLLFEYEVFGGTRLLPADPDKREKLLRVPSLPTAPKAPIVKVTHPFDSISGFGLNRPLFNPPTFGHARINRDKYAIYYRDYPDELATLHSFECEEFRHGETETFDVFVLFPPQSQSSGRLVCRATARNMPPFEQSIAIRHTATEQSPLDRLRQLANPPRVTLEI